MQGEVGGGGAATDSSSALVTTTQDPYIKFFKDKKCIEYKILNATRVQSEMSCNKE
jgi:hypothetical protein